ncbi:MAG: CinA family nicotinamide mononucleotide deamidase-related protein [Bacteroidetes bacterium]|nr:MAG: CinA family nicotinamide mononucleotide deamidase-related protein [Bacteroidota bacterium]
MDNIKASLITIGDELLIGQVIDTNSAWMAQQLNAIGIAVDRRVAVGDNKGIIWNALGDELTWADVVLITGGLGPTADDITKPLLCEYFGGKLVIDQAVLQHVEAIFARLNRPMIDRNRKQAEVPDVCTVLHNERGTAPGMLFEKDGKLVISMPGVPHEMKGIMTDHVLPLLQNRFQLPCIVHRTLLTAGVGESFLADHIQAWEEALPAHIKLAYLPNYGMVRLRLTATGMEAHTVAAEVDAQFSALAALVAPFLVTTADESMAAVVLRLLQQQQATMSTAESCTGGYIAHLLTSLPGSSQGYWGSVVSYHNQVKENLLGVNPHDLEADGAVSETVVRQMVAGALSQLKTHYAVAVSGIMGPNGGSPLKPVGTVWVAVASATQVVTENFHFRFDRTRNIELTATFALNMLRKLILSQGGATP